MAFGQTDSGSQACTVTTRHSLATKTTANIWLLRLDFNAAVGGTTPDIFEVEVVTKTLTGSTARIEMQKRVIGGQTDDNVEYGPFPSPHSIEFAITQTQGTGRTIDWSVMAVQ